MANEILLVEDEEKIARVLQLELKHEGYHVTMAADGRAGLQLAESGDWDLILLDIMLPEMSGLEVLRKFRLIDNRTPVILITARDAVPDRVSGLDLGANDYVTKPFAIEELLARIRNLMRITQEHDNISETITISDLLIDPKRHVVTRGGENIELTPKEFELLYYLAKHGGEVKSRGEIITDVWGYHYVGDTNIVDVYIRYLRQKVDAGYSSKLIQTIRGIGYRMDAGGDVS